MEFIYVSFSFLRRQAKVMRFTKLD